MGDNLFLKIVVGLIAFLFFGGFNLIATIIKKNKLKKQHIPKEHLVLLGVGAIYYRAHSDMERSLESPLTQREIRSMLKRDWGIKKKEEAIEMIESGTGGYIHSESFGAELEAYKASKNFDNVMNMFGQYYSKQQGFVAPEKFRNCRTTVAWDLERAAMITRYAFSIGLITEDEAWRYLYPIAARAKDIFETWEDYARSFLLGRCMWGGNKMDTSILNSVNFLLYIPPKNGQPFWVEYPLHA